MGRNRGNKQNTIAAQGERMWYTITLIHYFILFTSQFPNQHLMMLKTKDNLLFLAFGLWELEAIKGRSWQFKIMWMTHRRVWSFTTDIKRAFPRLNFYIVINQTLIPFSTVSLREKIFPVFEKPLALESYQFIHTKSQTLTVRLFLLRCSTAL